jgi:hypothetical protein
MYKLNKKARKIDEMNSGMNDRNSVRVKEKIRVGSYITKGR